MKTKIYYSLAITLCLATLFSCDESELDLNQDVNVTIQGIVYSDDESTPLADVLVEIKTDTVTTDANGQYTFENYEPGSYLVRFSKSNFSTMIQNISISAEEFSSSVVSSSPVIMFEKTETLNTVFLRDNGVESNPIAGAEVTLTYNFFSPSPSNSIYFENSTVKTTTDVNGVVSISGLPNVFVRLDMELVSGNQKFSRTEQNRPSDFNSFYLVTPISTTPFLLTETNLTDNGESLVNDFPASSNITFTFLEAINENFEDINVRLIDTFFFSEVEMDFSINGRTLSINPTNNLVEGNDYRVTLFLKSVTGNFYREDFDFQVESSDSAL